jgi:hypothetical protein
MIMESHMRCRQNGLKCCRLKSREKTEGEMMMLKMTEKSRQFLKGNLPEALERDDIGGVLWLLYDLIDEKGFAPPHYDEYNDFGREAQRVYDDLYLNN